MTPRPQRRYLDQRYYKFWRSWYHRMMEQNYGALFPLEADIGPDLRLPHEFHGIFIAGKAKIGSRVTILQHVTIGASLRDDGVVEVPVIEDDVLICANATIIGRTVIGRGAKIGAGVTLVDAIIEPGEVVINRSAYSLTKQEFVFERRQRARAAAAELTPPVSD